MKSLKFVFDLRKFQKQDLLRFMQKHLHLVIDGSGDSAVFILPQDMDIISIEKQFRPTFSLAHIEEVAIHKRDPYQILRFESQGQDMENLEVE